MSAPHPLRKLAQLEESLASSSGYTGTARWMIPYADLMTILLGFFIVLFAMVKLENITLTQTLKQAKAQLAQSGQAFDITEENTAAMLQSATESTQAALDPASLEAMNRLQQSISQDLALSGQKVRVHQDRRGVVLSFQDRIFFEPGAARLTPQARQTLDKLAGVLQQMPHAIAVEGHTDNTPIHTAQFPTNWELSTARATTIVKYLIDRHHFSPQRLSAGGYGEYYPVAENSTIKGKQKNRRVDIVVMNQYPGESGMPAQGSPPPAEE